MGKQECPYFNLLPTSEYFSVEQIEKCRQCRWISDRKIWCCYWKVWVVENKAIKFPAGTQQAKNVAKAIGKRIVNRKNRSEKEIEKLKAICVKCDAYYEKGLTPRCTYCGCCLNLKTKWQSEDCPIGKW